jgi:hypothetical protein
LFHGEGSVFLLNGRKAADVTLRICPPLGCFREESFESRRSDIDEHADRLVGIILESVDRTPRSVNTIAWEHVSPGTVQQKANSAVDDIEPFVFVFVVVRSGPAARWSNVEKCSELLAGLFAIEQYDHCVAKCIQRTPFIGAYQKRRSEGWSGCVSFDTGQLIDGVVERKQAATNTFHQSGQGLSS